MNEMARSERRTPAEEPPDSLFGFVGGLYLALLVSPGVLAAAVALAGTDAAVLYGVLLTTAVVVTGAGWRYLTGRPGIAVALGRTRARWLPATAGLAVTVLAFASLHATGPVGAVGFFLGLFAMLLGLALAGMATTRYVTAITARTEEAAAWRSGWPRVAKRRRQWLVGVLSVVALAAFTVGIFADRSWLWAAGNLLFAASIGALSTSEERDYVAWPAGLEVRHPVARRLHSWDAFEDWEHTDDAIVLRRRWRPDLRFALADLDDPEAVERAVAAQLS